ncbi:XRE family transcriptional regulator [Ktedonosporobacter rubrisoli]|uniref:XRE family transcriptional regulator n=1 Tax=Ktedonosporobacter rubrisoli TaxID=2509675 RepID=A0A4P6JZH1_KTERU|nr:helix-turn-helix transcriptional regulator [Ktedonosporobacter rubrisoli]QBD81298.1 XRE family transcriptional regulator [Ktedonosporobacter rubrisoli]
MAFHYGQIIKEYRERHKMTQAKLAELWPKKDGGVGVNTRYVQDVEYGSKKIDDQGTLRKLATLLEIPLWRFGLSEYDPFNPASLPGAGVKLYNETLDVTEGFIKQTLAMRRTASLPEVQRSAQSLQRLFDYFSTYTPPSTRLEPRFLSLYAQGQSLQGLMYFEHRQYAQALETFEAMYATSQQLGDPVLQVHALQKLAVELNRARRKQEAVQAMEEARDLSFKASKYVAAFANAYLAHIYAAAGEALRFERAITTAQSLAASLGSSYGDGTDFVVHKMSSILQLRSRGYLRIGEPRKTLALHDELRSQIQQDSNLWLDFRLQLYRAKAYLMLHDVEACLEAAREFFRDVVDWRSPHRLSRGDELLRELEAAGYGELKAVKELKEELREAARNMASHQQNKTDARD